jgi:hypothetical protein
MLIDIVRAAMAHGSPLGLESCRDFLAADLDGRHAVVPMRIFLRIFIGDVKWKCANNYAYLGAATVILRLSLPSSPCVAKPARRA